LVRGINARTRYALMAALDLAEHFSPEQPIKLQEIAARTGAPPKYLVHILLSLKRRALVNSTRGANGGYWLLRRPEMISIGEVIAAVEKTSRPGPPPTTAYECAVEELQRQLERAHRETLGRTSLADLLRAAHRTQ